MSIKGIVFYNRAFFSMASDEVLIKENVSRILLTTPGERINNPRFGSKLKQYLFELESIMREEVESEIVSSIARWEPRVAITEIETELKDERTFMLKLHGNRVDTLENFTYERLIRL